MDGSTNMLLLIAIYLCTLFYGTTSGQLETTESYTHSATLRTGNIRVYWTFNDSHITFEVQGQTTGWIGIGLSPNGAMTGADIFVGWVKDDLVKVTDRHGVGNTFPPLDPKQDIDVVGGTECDGWTMFKFSRQLAACEAEYDRKITQNTQRLIWAWGDNDPTGDDIDDGHFHGSQRGAESMYFLDSAEKPSGLPDGPTYETFEILMDNFEIPALDTYYNCKIFKLPKLTKKHHIVKYEPIIQEGHELNVHHMLVYRCGDTLEDPSELLRDERCYSPNMQHFQTCTTVIAEWAVGAGATIFPESAGFSIGGSEDPTYIQIEIHYDNPMEKSNIIDSSGIRFTYTDTVRQHDIGVLIVGSVVNGVEHFIPPGSDNFLTVSHCNSECLESGMSLAEIEDLNVFSIMLHSHVAGRTLKFRHIRDGIELPSPAYDDHYDFNYQEARYLHPPLTLKPTDRLQMECVYNTEDRKNITQGGLGTRHEMCVWFLFYYPRIDFRFCVSSVPKEDLWTFFGINFSEVHFTSKSPADGIDQGFWQVTHSDTNVSETLLDRANKFDWNPETIKSFESFTNSISHYQYCGMQDRSKSTLFVYNVTKIDTPYLRSPKRCDKPYLPLSGKTSSSECLGAEDSTTTTIVDKTSGASSVNMSRLISTILLAVSYLISL